MAAHSSPLATHVDVRQERRSASWLLMLGAPLAALAGGAVAQWLDFQALRVPLLLLVGCGTLATAVWAIERRREWRPWVVAGVTGVATWTGVEATYVILHLIAGERFHADRLGPQASQALGLIAAHGLFLGLPTGIAAAVAWHGARLWRRQGNDG